MDGSEVSPGEEVWSFETGDDVDSSPAVADGAVYVGSRDNNLYAVDASDGTEVWRFETDNGVFSSPAVADVSEGTSDGSSTQSTNGTVYVGSRDSRLYAVDAEDGTEVWSFEADDWVDSSPTVVDGTVYFGSDDNNLYAVNTEDGEEVWSFETGDLVDSSPAVKDGTVYVGSRDNNLYAVNASDGTEVWSFETGNDVFSSPAVADGTVYVGSEDNNLYALDAEDGSGVWRFGTGDSVWSSPTVVDGTVYFGSDDFNFYALDAEDEREVWSFWTGSGTFSSPTVVNVSEGTLDGSSARSANGTVYAGSEDNSLYALDAEDGSEVWSFETGGSVDSSPTVVDVTEGTSDGSSTQSTNGTVYFGSSDGNLYAVEAGVPESSPFGRAALGGGVGVGFLLGAYFLTRDLWENESGDGAERMETERRDRR